MKVIIEFIEDQSTYSGWRVTYGDKYADHLGYDEMLGLVSAITMPDVRSCLQWLKTEEQHKAYEDYINTKHHNQ